MRYVLTWSICIINFILYYIVWMKKPTHVRYELILGHCATVGLPNCVYVWRVQMRPDWPPKLRLRLGLEGVDAQFGSPARA